jgi:octaprenyl-diphosphate synthase
MMNYLSLIKEPIIDELDEFKQIFDASLLHSNGMLSEVLSHIRKRAGKRMRPMLVLLTAKNYGPINSVSLRSAVGLELLHTASLVHDDVVDESSERRGQASVNAIFNNKISVLVGDYLLSTALMNVSLTGNNTIVRYLSELGRTLANGEILQLSNIANQEISEDVYYQVIRQKTAALFAACAQIGALSSGATPEQVEDARLFGDNLGIIFQIRDDIFDYYKSDEIGKPTGNDMAEGKLTLPVIYALRSTGDQSMYELANKVKTRTINNDEISKLVDFTLSNGGIEYAEKRMNDYRENALQYISKCTDESVGFSLKSYIDYVIERNK